MMRRRFLIILFFGLLALQAKAGIYSELVLDWRIYLNSEGKYEIVYSPEDSNPYNWEIEGKDRYNAFELRRALFGYQTSFNDYVSMDAAVLLEDSEKAGMDFRLDRGFVEIKRPKNPYYDFKVGYLLTPVLEWERQNIWPYEMFEFAPLQFQGLLPRSQAGALAGFGYQTEEGGAALWVDYLTDPVRDAQSSNRFDARGTAGVSFGEFVINGIFNYSFRGRRDREGFQELTQAGLSGQISRLKLGGEYYQGNAWISAGDVYLLGNFPEGLEDFLLVNGRVYAEDEQIDFHGWSVMASLQPVNRVFLVYRFDFFDPSRRYDDDQQDLNLAGIVYEATDSLWLGAAFELRDFAGRDLPDHDQEHELRPFQVFSLNLQARLP